MPLAALQQLIEPKPGRHPCCCPTSLACILRLTFLYCILFSPLQVLEGAPSSRTGQQRSLVHDYMRIPPLRAFFAQG